jgi:hypothetical protein
LRVAKNDSATALSKQTPVAPIDWVTVSVAQWAWKAWLV